MVAGPNRKPAAGPSRSRIDWAPWRAITHSSLEGESMSAITGMAALMTEPRDGFVIDWRRMAKPQADGYDTGIILKLMSVPSRRRSQPYVREAPQGGPMLFGGRVEVRNRESGGLKDERFVPAPPDHPNLPVAECLLGAWPEMAMQFPLIVSTIQPWQQPQKPPEYWQEHPGSGSHHKEEEFGTIMITVDSSIALAEAMVHEMAHHKLYAMGVPRVEVYRLIVNDPSELYVSPVVQDRKRPMTAVLHAQYSFMHVTALDIAMYEGPEMISNQKSLARLLLQRNVKRMEAGYQEIAKHARTDEEGRAFLEGFMQWSEDVLSHGRDILGREHGC